MQPSSSNKINKDIKGAKQECSHADRCGGCTYMGMTYEETLELKQKTIGKLLKGLPISVSPIIPVDDPYYYRNKVHSAFATAKGGKVICGMYELSSHKIVQNSGCFLENKIAAKIIESIKSLAQSFKLPIYNEVRGNGVLRRVLIRTADATGEILVVLVSGSPVFPGKKNFVKALVQKHPEITSVVLNINNRRDSMILGNKSETVYGKGFITDKLCDLYFKISAESFYQINRSQTEKLYSTAIDMAELSKNDKVIDAYCGIGTIGLSASKYAGKVVGVELNSKAVSDAIYNAKNNKVNNSRFYQGDASEFMVQTAAKGEKYDVVLLDPPRAGTTLEFIKACERLSPRRVVYVSCNPETLARDLPVFMEHGYNPDCATPVDMFPWTDSIETVVSLTKHKVD